VKLNTGPYDISYSDIPGFVTPPDENVSIAAGITSVSTGFFTKMGVLRVVTQPPTEATIYVDGTPMNNWGVWTYLPVGTYQVCFGPAAGKAQPGCQTANVNILSQTDLTGL